MAEDLNRRARELAHDRISGASELMGQAVALFREALNRGIDPRAVGRELVGAQPSMAPLWNLAGHAIAAAGNPSRFEHFAAQLDRAPHTLARHALNVLLADEPSGPVHVATLSFSGTVLRTLQELARHRPLRVSCAEGRPALEGRRMAEQLAASGIAVTLYADAALEQALDSADDVLVGTDAISPEWFLNKSGTRMLAAAAAQRGLPVYVCATRDKFLSRAVASRLSIRDEPPGEIWPSPPPGVSVQNRYFERTPLDLVTAVLSDLGVLGAALVPDACPTAHDALLLDSQADLRVGRYDIAGQRPPPLAVRAGAPGRHGGSLLLPQRRRSAVALAEAERRYAGLEF